MASVRKFQPAQAKIYLTTYKSNQPWTGGPVSLSTAVIIYMYYILEGILSIELGLEKGV